MYGSATANPCFGLCKMPFGKYQGRVIIDLPEEYLLWFAKKEFPKGELGLLMQLAMEILRSVLTEGAFVILRENSKRLVLRADLE